MSNFRKGDYCSVVLGCNGSRGVVFDKGISQLDIPDPIPVYQSEWELHRIGEYNTVVTVHSGKGSRFLSSTFSCSSTLSRLASDMSISLVPRAAPRSELLASRSQLTISVRLPRCALKERPDAVLLDDLHHFVQCFPVGVERLIPDGRSVLLVDDLEYTARIALAAVGVDLNPGVVPGDLSAQRRHGNYWIGHGFAILMNGPSEV